MEEDKDDMIEVAIGDEAASTCSGVGGGGLGETQYKSSSSPPASS